ncbi:MAG: hypothetical protein KIS79_04530 [Burkholderiales bacterium]|nr:hypothetical protein [Burkholderiales bacterium]
MPGFRLSLQRLPLVATMVCAAAASVLPPAGPVQAATPSFLCTRATTWVEKTICGSERLSTLDLELATVYAHLLRTATPQTERELTASQRHWWGLRAQCRMQTDGQDCLRQRYDERIAQLKARPDYSEARPMRNVELPPEQLSVVGEGWSKSLSHYLKAIRACLVKAPAPVQWVGSAWEATTHDRVVTVRLRTADEQAWLCTAQRNGLEVLAWQEIGVQEELPPEGPLLYPGSEQPRAACGRPVKVLDENDVHIGWLGPRCEEMAGNTAR